MHAPVKQVSSSSNDCPMNLKPVIQTLLEPSSSFYLFVDNHTNVQHLMDSHGLHWENLILEQCQHAICYHIVKGLCASIPVDENLKHSACSDI
jgi:hypothetical protein